MTNTTSVQLLTRNTRVTSQEVRPQPRLATLLAQAAAGSILGGLAVVMARVLLVYRAYEDALLIVALPFVLVFGLVTGAVAGLIIWACSRVAHGPLHGINRSAIGMLVLAGFFSVAFFFNGAVPKGTTQAWVIATIVVSGIAISSITGSRLRPGRELVRGGEANAPVLRILAGLTGLILRVSVVLLFVASFIGVISTIRTFDSHSETGKADVVWSVLLFCHFTAGVLILLVRMKFSSVAVLAAIAATPLIVSLGAVPEMIPLVRYIIIGYLATWAMFLLTCWRQTEVALSTVREELRYYLID